MKVAKSKAMNTAIKAGVLDNLQAYELENFEVKTLRVESKALKGNPLRDSHVRYNPVLTPKSFTTKEPWLPVVFVLAGLTSNGPKYFSPKPFEENAPQALDRALGRGEAPRAVYVFVDAMTFWGGSQFLDSPASGNYQSYIIDELIPAVRAGFRVSEQAKDWCVSGHSSGGYGALQLASQFPECFGVCAALAPDSDFVTSLLPDLYGAAPTLQKLGVKGVRREIEDGRFFRRKEAFKVQLAIAMAACYSPDKKISSQSSFPIDLSTGELKKDLWKKWLEKDPVVFLPKRQKSVKKLNKVYLDVGRFDQFHLMFGVRKIRKILEDLNVDITYREFDGNHFDSGPSRLELWKWLVKIW